jgi:hypothetical protein
MVAAAPLWLVTACKSTGGTGVPAACPPTTPNVRIAAVLQINPGSTLRSVVDTMRTTPFQTGTWSPIAFVSTSGQLAGFRNITDLDEVTIPQGSRYGCDVAHAVLCVDRGLAGELVYYRQAANGTWSTLTTLSSGLGTGSFVPALPWRFGRVSVGRVAEELHVCAVTKQAENYTRESGKLAHTVRTFNANLDAGGFERQQFTDWNDVTGTIGLTRPVVDVACAGVRNTTAGNDELHVCAVLDDGKLWHAIRSAAGSWTVAGDVAAQAGQNGPFTRVDCAALGNQLHVVAVNTGGEAWYTIRAPNAWRAFENVGSGATTPSANIVDVAIGFWNEGLPAGDWQLIIVATVSGPLYPTSPLYYTVRSNRSVAWPGGAGPSQWKPMADLVGEANYADPSTGGSLASASVSSRSVVA